MIEPTCIIFSHKNDEHLPEVLELFAASEFPFVVDLNDFGHSFAVSLNPSNPRATTLRLQTGEVLSISRLKSVWWRRPTGTVIDPATPDHLRTFVGNERALFLDGFFSCLPPEVRQYNNPHAQKLLNSKPYQLNLAKQVGLTIPDTCITSDPFAAKHFVRKHPRTVFKSLWATADFWRPTRMLTPELQDRLDQVLVCPVIFQEFIEGDTDLRVTVIDDEIHAVAFDLSNSRYPADVRMDNRITCQKCEIDLSVREKIKEFMRRSALRYGAFDFRHGSDGAITFFEINPAGQFLYLDHRADTEIAAALAQALAREGENTPESSMLCSEVADERGWPDVHPIPFLAFGPDIKYLT
jgi:hypothetical protein